MSRNVLSLLLAAACCFFAQRGAAQPTKHDAADLHRAVIDVTFAGAKIYNENGDHAGCYRIYQGGLMTLRPYLAKDLQKKVDQSFANAEKMPTYVDRAFELRRALDQIRDATRPAPVKKADDG